MRTVFSCAMAIVRSIAGLTRYRSYYAVKPAHPTGLTRAISLWRVMFIAISALIPAYSQQTTVTIDTPVSGQAYSGTQVFGGWAVDSGSEIADVLVMMDGVTPGVVAAYGGNRQDVCNIYVDYPGCPNVGWNYSVDTTQLTNGWHYIRVWVTTVDGRQTIQDSTFYTSNPSASIVDIDSPSYGAAYSGGVVFGGWAVDGSATISAVKVFIDGAPVGNAATGGYRPDVCNAIGNYPGCPYVGWSYWYDTTQLPDGNHEFTVTTVTSDGRATTASVLYFAAQNSKTTIVDIDTPQYLSRYWSTDVIGGWAMDSTSALASVNVSIDGVPFGAAAIGNRQDACNAIGNWPGCPNVGWSYALDTTQLTEGAHELAVTATLANGTQTTQTQTFVVQNAPSADSESLIGGASDGSGPPIKCNASDYNLSSRAMTGSPQQDGLVHVTYSVDSTDPAVTEPIIDAIQSWNSGKATTGVEFDPPAPGQHVDLPIQFSTSADTNRSCAYHDPNRVLIVYGNTWKNSNAKQAIITHELGHYLGLDDVNNPSPNIPTVMNQPSNGWPDGCLNPNTASRDITPFDIPEVSICRAVTQGYQALINQRQKQIDASKTPHQFTITDPYPSPGAPGTTVCTYIYETVDFYVDGVYDSSQDFVVDVICN